RELAGAARARTPGLPSDPSASVLFASVERLQKAADSADCRKDPSFQGQPPQRPACLAVCDRTQRLQGPMAQQVTPPGRSRARPRPFPQALSLPTATAALP